MKKLDIKEYSKKYREKNREKLRKIGLSHYYRRKKELEEIRKKYIDFQFIPCYWDNMKERSKPTISKYTRKPFTKITFIPDYSKFGINKILFKKR